MKFSVFQKTVDGITFVLLAPAEAAAVAEEWAAGAAYRKAGDFDSLYGAIIAAKDIEAAIRSVRGVPQWGRINAVNWDQLTNAIAGRT